MGKPSSLSGLAKTNDRHAEKAEGASGMSDWINEPGGPQTRKPDGEAQPLRRLNVDIPESLHKALKRKALDEDTTVRELVEAALLKAMGQ
jgi:predicted HicB family RNase H-like nuclease